MISLLISLLVSSAAAVACRAAPGAAAYAPAAAIAGFLLAYLGIGAIVRKKITGVQNGLQEILLNGQKQASRKIQLFQSKPGGNIKQLQRQIEADQKALISEALAFTDRLEPFRKWTLMMGRQIATLRMQFLYQLNRFDQVDQILASGGLFKGPLMMEPMIIAMKMARQFKNGDPDGAEKTFKKHIKWMRGNRGTLLYGLMSWIHMQQGDSEKARQLLIKGKEVTGNETLARNWEMLSNNKDSAFSNAGLGEEWYGLYLETPPLPKPQKVRVQSRGRRF